MSVSDINCIIVVSFTSDGSCIIVEIEVLGSSIVGCLDYESIGDMINESHFAQHRLNMEWSVDILPQFLLKPDVGTAF